MRLSTLERAAFPIAYVTNEGSDTASVIYAATSAVITTITVGSTPYGIAFR